MPDYEKAAERAAKKYGIDPAIFKAQLRQESGLKPGLTSSAGAQGIAQFMPATAKQYGVNLNDGRVSDDLDGAARYMRDNLDRTGDDYKAALSIYNSGRADAYKDPNFAGGQTYHYVNSILSAAKVKAPKTAAPNRQAGPAVTTRTTTTPGVDNAPLRRQLVGDFLQHGGVTNPNAVLSLAGSYGQAADVPGTTKTTSTYGQPKAQPKVRASNGNGASAALSWAESKIGFKETGTNSGGLASYANQRFGMSNQPWCAMFTSLAVTKGGAPKTARTASVAEVRRQAEQGGGGYQHGFIPTEHAKAGDLILFGNDHIGMVQKVVDGKVFYVGGNQSNGVTEAQVAAGGGDIVRPKYSARKKK
jgi:hypothetical protein